VFKYKKELLQDYVLKIGYPLEEAFKVCEQCNNKTAMAYTLIKSGRNLEGVMLIADLFIASSKEVFRDLAKGNETDTTKELLDKMSTHLGKILEVCTCEYANDPHRGEETWEKVTEKIFKGLNAKVVDSIPIVRIR
jgi:CRISPR/Cas system-associated protein Cas7 (RAMP superfamily)